MMAGTPVKIAVVFEPNRKARPVWFELNNRRHQVKDTTYFWQDRVGETPLLHFAVTDGEALYELVYNTCDQSWQVHRQEIE